MKNIFKVFGVLFCAFLMPAGGAQKANETQIETIIEWLIIAPLVRDGSTGGGDIDVVIIDDQAVRESMVELYAGYQGWLSILSERALIQQGDLYIDPKSGREAYVSRFEIVNEDGDKCVVSWKRVRSKIAGFEKVIELKRVNGRWLIVKIDTKYVS